MPVRMIFDLKHDDDQVNCLTRQHLTIPECSAQWESDARISFNTTNYQCK